MLSQALMDRLGREASRLQGTRLETIVYHARATVTATPVDHTVEARFRTYRLTELAIDLVGLTDEECMIRTALISWTPTRYDTISRSTGTLWKVMRVTGGGGRPHYLLQCHQEA